MKPSRLGDHLSRIHPEMKDQPLAFFENFQAGQAKQVTVTSMFAAASKQNDDGLLASFNILLMIAKSGQPHTIGEDLILPAIK
ncbi:hypothetical protein M8J75_002708 [Diaphorina citri]|nr:hypothetical protein M8J75_002708 [Diaphorina citri]